MLGGAGRKRIQATLGEYAVLVATFEASSHVEAMTNYYFMYDRGEYVSGHQCDYDPYPDEWLTRQHT